MKDVKSILIFLILGFIENNLSVKVEINFAT